MRFLPAPWRWAFISRIGKKKECVFCEALKLPERESLICYKGEKFFIILNKYPYSSGHLMIVPYAHAALPGDIAPQDTIEMWELLDKSLAILKNSFHPGGFNIGMNIGQAAGAGVKDHIHLHIVPRWEGDANFMAVVGKTKVVSYSIDTVFEILTREFNK